MTDAPETLGIANDLYARECINTVERHLPAEAGRASVTRFAFWADADVRRALIAQHRFMSGDAMRRRLIEQYGAERTPSRSALNRFWHMLDAFWSRRA